MTMEIRPRSVAEELAGRGGGSDVSEHDWHRCWVPTCGAEVRYKLYAEVYRQGVTIGFCAKHEPRFEWVSTSGSGVAWSQRVSFMWA